MKGTVLKDTGVGQAIDYTGSKLRDRIEKHIGIYHKGSRKQVWLSGEKIKQFVQEIQEAISISILTSTYEKKVMQYGEFKLSADYLTLLDRFLMSDKEKVLCVCTKMTLLSTLKILQHLNTKKDYISKGRISTTLNDLKCKEIRYSVAKAFMSEYHNLLTIEITLPINEHDIDELYYKFSDIIKGNLNKKIILTIHQNKHNVLVEKFRSYFQNWGLYVEITDDICLKDFEPVEDPLQKKVLVFQDQKKKNSLAELIDIDCWKTYVDYLSQGSINENLDIIDIVTLIKILDNDEIKIGSKILRTSSLEGAYTNLYEEINTVNFANKLLALDHNYNDIYIICGISGSSKKEKIEKLFEYVGLANEQERILKHLKFVGSDNKIQMVDDQFTNKQFVDFCHEFPEKKIFWIHVKNRDNEFVFILQQFYNPKFYIKRKFKKSEKIVIGREHLKEYLVKDNLSEIFIFNFVNNLKKFVELFDLTNESEKEKIENNFKIDKIRLFASEVKAEAVFQELCKESQTVHWLKLEQKQLIWCNSHGSLNIMQVCIEKKQCIISHIEEDNLINEIRDKKIVIIADDPGMGKTSSLTKLYESKSFIETHWVIRINLRDHLQAIKHVELNSIDIVSVVNFFLETDSTLNKDLAKNLLRISLDKSKHFSKTLLIAFDGFDELLDETDRNKVMLLLKFLKNETPAKLWITTRVHYRKNLENELSTFATAFIPMDHNAKVEYIKKYFKDRMSLILTEEKFAELFVNCDVMQEYPRILKYIEAFLNKMKSIFKHNVSRFIGTPLQMYLMLEDYKEHFQMWTDNNDLSPEIGNFGSDIWEVYENFFDKKYNIYFKKVGILKCVLQKQIKCLLEQYNKDFAKSKILNTEPKDYFKDFKAIVLSVGIIHSQGINFKFIHPTFEEFFAAKVFAHWMIKNPNKLSNLNKQEFLLRDILMKPDYELIRTFINAELGKIAERNFLGKNMKQYGKISEKLLKEKESLFLVCVGETLLHVAVDEGNASIVSFLLNSLKEHPEILYEFLFTSRKFIPTALCIACEAGDLEIIRILLDAAGGISEDTMQEYLHFYSSYASPLLSAVLGSSHIGVVKELLTRAKDKLGLIMIEEEGVCSFCSAFKHKNEEFVKDFLDEFKHDDAALKQLLFCLGNETALHKAMCFNPIFNYLLYLAENIKDNKDTLKKLILSESPSTSLLMEAVTQRNLEIIHRILNSAKNINDHNQTLKKLLLCQDVFGKTALHLAAINLDHVVIHLLLETAASLGYKMLEDIIFASDRNHENVIEYLFLENEDCFNSCFKIFRKKKYRGIQNKIKRVISTLSGKSPRLPNYTIESFQLI